MNPMTIAELVDIGELRELCESFSAVTGIAIAILDLDGKILIATGWWEICTLFHRVNPETALLCRESDTVLASQLAQGKMYNVYKCKNGLVDVAVPIEVAGQHIGNLFTGQFLFEAPDEAFFMRQAERYGFDTRAYMEALRKIPVISEERTRITISYLLRLARLIGEMGQARKGLQETNERLVRQIDQNKATLDALVESEAKYRSMAANIPGAVYRLHIRPDGSSYFSYSSPRMLDLFGISLGPDDSYEDFANRIHPDDRAAFIESSRRAVEGCTPWSSEARVLMPDGGMRWAHAVSSPTRIGGEVVFDGVVLDITERKRLEDSLVQAQKMETVGLLAGGVAHDFNNLLTPILGYSDMLLKDTPADSVHYPELQQLVLAAERARDLTRRLLAFSRKQIIELKTVCLSDILHPFGLMLRQTIRENIEIDVRIPSSLGLVRADPVQIEQLLLNLSVNAQDAMPEGGTITIAVEDILLDESRSAELGGAPAGPYTMLTISDTGSGMAPAVMEHIFEPFFTTKELGKGTGLGLSTVYGIVKQHGGFITVKSEKNRGSIFTVLLPRAERSVAAGARPPFSFRDLARGSETVLVVDDNEMVRNLACSMLRSLGYRVLSVRDTERCIELARIYRSTIDLLLTDVVMPRMNGMQLHAALRRSHPALKAVYMSGYHRDVLGTHGVLDEGIFLIQKPFSMSELADKVRSALSR